MRPNKIQIAKKEKDLSKRIQELRPTKIQEGYCSVILAGLKEMEFDERKTSRTRYIESLHKDYPWEFTTDSAGQVWAKRKQAKRKQ